MAKPSNKRSTKPAWQTQWPRNGDLKTWFRVMIKKCDAIPDADLAAEKAHLPIESLAEMGEVTEALRHVNRYLRRVSGRLLETVRMAELGAKICLEADDLPGMEKYLSRVEAAEALVTRKCDKGFAINSVRDFRAQHGLLDPAEAKDEDERIEATMSWASRKYKQAQARGQRAAARQAVMEMEAIARQVKEDWRRQSYLERTIVGYAELEDAAAVKRCLLKINKSDRDQILEADMLIKLNMKSEAIARARHDIAEELRGLRESGDPNIHFPVMAIRRWLTFLVKQGEKDEARRWLQRALKEAPQWPVLEYGQFTSAVYQSLAEAMALIDGPAAAAKLLEQAIGDAKVEKRSEGRKAAVDDVLELKANLGRLEEAIEDARKMRSPVQRRKTLGKLLAKAKRWKELRQVLSQVESPEEAAETAWWIKFELPGGEVE